jgi:hypothetical protein
VAATTTEPLTPATALRTPDTGGLNLGDTPKTEGAAVEMSDGRTVTKIPSSSCIQTTATPLVIGEYAVFATHKKTPKPDDPYGDAGGCAGDDTKPGLYAVSLVSGRRTP